MKIHKAILFLVLSALVFSGPAMATIQNTDDALYNMFHTGEIWGQFQSITMHQTWDESQIGDRWEGDSSSSSMSFTMGYESAQWHNFSIGSELQVVDTIWEDGDDDALKNKNDNTESINQLYLRYEDKRHNLQIGRQQLNLEFLRDNLIRSKIHYYEGIIYRGNLTQNFNILLGNITRFSGLSQEWFKDIDTTFSLKGAIDRNGSNITGSAKDNIGQTNGVFVGHMTYKGLPHTSIDVYDYRFDDIINIIGGNMYFQPPIGKITEIFKGRFAKQNSIGNLDELAEVNAHLTELSAGFKYNSLQLSAGYTMISDPEANETNKIFAPYDSTFIVDTGMLGAGLLGSLNAGSNTLWFEGRYNKGRFKSLANLWMTKDYNGNNNRELNVILTYYLTKHFYAKNKNAFGWFDNYNGPGDDMEKQDYRIFIGYEF